MTALEPVRMTVPITVTIRAACEDDLPRLEWYGQYRHFRRVFRRAYQDQVAGHRLLLVADMQSFPIGQLFINFHSNRGLAARERSAYLYAFRVMEMFRGQGIGTRLLDEAERIAAERGVHRLSIAVAQTNTRALQLYERMGYRRYATDEGHWQYVDHKGVIRHSHEPCWLLEKSLTMM
ncbi:GNAT family N-acetyltransferase [bacterium]|nr:GNAT family N-acetyltransferase [bacterium]